MLGQQQTTLETLRSRILARQSGEAPPFVVERERPSRYRLHHHNTFTQTGDTHYTTIARSSPGKNFGLPSPSGIPVSVTDKGGFREHLLRDCIDFVETRIDDFNQMLIDAKDLEDMVRG